jgi:hypothetical protein
MIFSPQEIHAKRLDAGYAITPSPSSSREFLRLVLLNLIVAEDEIRISA